MAQVTGKTPQSLDQNPVDYHQRLEEKIQAMMIEKQSLLIQCIDELIEEHIARDGRNKIFIVYDSIANKINYRFPASVLEIMINKHYQQLGFSVSDNNDFHGLYLVINPKQTVVENKQAVKTAVVVEQKSNCCTLI